MKLLWPFLLVIASTTPAKASQNYCALNDEHILILIDRTTQYDERDKEILISGLSEIFEKLSAGDEVIVHTIVDEFSKSDVVFHQCYPGCPSGFFESFFGSCKGMLARSDRARFKRKLVMVSRGILENPLSYPHSDIARTIASVTWSYADNHGNPARDLTEVFIFSDMIENSKEIPWPNILQSDPNQILNEFRQSGFSPNLNNTQISIFGFGRGHDDNRKALPLKMEGTLKNFWIDYMKGAGASKVYIGQRLN